MTEALQDILLSSPPTPSTSTSSPNPQITLPYLTHLTSLPLASINNTEPERLRASHHTNSLQIEALAQRSIKPIISTLDHVEAVQASLAKLAGEVEKLNEGIPEVEERVSGFAGRYGRGGSVVGGDGGEKGENDSRSGSGSGSGSGSRNSNGSGNEILERRRKALLLYRNVHRVSDVLALPTLLASSINSASSSGTAVTSAATVPTSASASAATPTSSLMNYSSALDLQAHTKRLHALYPDLRIIQSLSADVDAEMKRMTSNLISGLQAPTLKLAGAMRTVGWLRRVAPELADPWGVGQAMGAGAGAGGSSYHSTSTISLSSSSAAQESETALSTLFLGCRLVNLEKQLSALAPFRELAEQEAQELKEEKNRQNQQKQKRYEADKLSGGAKGERSQNGAKGRETRSRTSSSTSGQHTERYLKKYVEIFREHSFSIISMHKSIFPGELGGTVDIATTATDRSVSIKSSDDEKNTKTTNNNNNSAGEQFQEQRQQNPFLPLPSPLSTFVLHLSSILSATLSHHLPNVRDRSARDSLLTQVLYCAGSLGRLGCDVGMLIALLEGGGEEADANDSSGEEEGIEVEEEEDVDAVKEEDGEEKEEKGGEEGRVGRQGRRRRETEAWAEVMRRHRAQASRLELLASGVGSGKGTVRASKNNNSVGQLSAQG